MTVEQVKEAVNTIQDYCSERQSCIGCIFYKPYQLGFCEINFKNEPYEWKLEDMLGGYNNELQRNDEKTSR